MEKSNVFRSSSFHMDEGDRLHMLIIDETGDEVTFVLGGAEVEVVPSAPTASAATEITDTTFVANWSLTENTLGYYLDVAYDEDFTSFVAGYENLSVGNVIEYNVIGLVNNYSYYVQVRGYNDIGTSESSNVITLTTLPLEADDWFLPSVDELSAMYDNLYNEFDVGGFTSNNYWSSSEIDNTTSYAKMFINGNTLSDAKNILNHIRACRSFIAGVGAYSLRDNGPAGGFIFYIDGAGTTYYEAAPIDQSASCAWSNVTATLIGTTGTAIGTGQDNTDDIIAQPGHVTSAAKLCDDYEN